LAKKTETNLFAYFSRKRKHLLDIFKHHELGFAYAYSSMNKATYLLMIREYALANPHKNHLIYISAHGFDVGGKQAKFDNSKLHEEM